MIESDSPLLNSLSNQNIFLSIGSRELHYFKKFNLYNFFIRTVEKPQENTFPIKSKFLHERGPFFLENEINLLKKYYIKLLISKNSGGEQTYPKIEASRKLNIPVIIVSRPKLSSTEVSYSFNETIDWISKIVIQA